MRPGRLRPSRPPGGHVVDPDKAIPGGNHKRMSEEQSANRSRSKNDDTGKPANPSRKTPGSAASSSGASATSASASKPASSSTHPSASGNRSTGADTKTGPASDAGKNAGASGPHREADQKTSASTSGATKTPGASQASAGASDDRAAGHTAGGHKNNGGGRGRGIALIVAVVALVIAILSILAAGLVWYRGQQRMAALDQQIGSAASNVKSNLQQQITPRVAQLDQQVGQLSDRLGQVAQNEQSRGQQIDSVQQSLEQLRSQNAQLQSALGGNHEQFVEQRILALLEAANQRLTIYHDPQGAMQALQMADQAIAHSGLAQLHPVRSDIADEVAALQALPNPDIEGLALRLSKLADRVPKLPVATNVPSTYHNGDIDGTGNDDASSGNGNASNNASRQSGWAGVDWQGHWQRLTHTLGNALSHMVTVRSANGTQNAPALMAPDQSFFLAQNLQLELRMARLALLNHNGQVYHSSLSEARQWVSQYFNTDDSATKAVLNSLKQLSDVQLDWQSPDITPSLQRMRRLLNESDDTADASAAAGPSGSKNTGSTGADASGNDQNASQGDTPATGPNSDDQTGQANGQGGA